MKCPQTQKLFLKSACALFEQSKSPGHHHSVRSNSWPKRPAHPYHSEKPNRSRRESTERRCGKIVRKEQRKPLVEEWTQVGKYGIISLTNLKLSIQSLKVIRNASEENAKHFLNPGYIQHFYHAITCEATFLQKLHQSTKSRHFQQFLIQSLKGIILPILFWSQIV